MVILDAGLAPVASIQNTDWIGLSGLFRAWRCLAGRPLRDGELARLNRSPMKMGPGHRFTEN